MLDSAHCIRVEQNNVFKLLQSFESLAGVLEHSASGNQQGARTTVGKNELNLIDRLGSVNGNRDCADAQDRQVSYGPLRPVFRNQRDAVTRANAQLNQTKRN